MYPLLHLALIRAGVFAAVVAANKTRPTPVLYFLFVAALLVNIGVLPAQSDPSIREFAKRCSFQGADLIGSVEPSRESQDGTGQGNGREYGQDQEFLTQFKQRGFPQHDAAGQSDEMRVRQQFAEVLRKRRHSVKRKHEA